MVPVMQPVFCKGGGKDLTRQSGQVKKGDVEAKKTTSFSKEAQAEFRRKEQERLETLKADIEKMIEQSPQLAQFKKQMLLDITSEGLRIQIVDEQNRPMFDSGGAELKPYTRDILRQIGKALNDVKNRISLAGHTDAAGFVGGAVRVLRIGSYRLTGQMHPAVNWWLVAWMTARYCVLWAWLPPFCSTKMILWARSTAGLVSSYLTRKPKMPFSRKRGLPPMRPTKSPSLMG
jgi:hypothetical protein